MSSQLGEELKILSVVLEEVTKRAEEQAQIVGHEKAKMDEMAAKAAGK